MGCCGSGKSDIDELEDDDQRGGGHQYIKSWHDGMSLEEKKKIAKQNKYSECFLCKCCGIFGVWSGLKCCCCAFSPEQPFLSIKKDRHCTDIPCCLLFILTLFTQFFLFITAVTQYDADPRRLLFYSDWNGTLCAPDWSLEYLVDNDNETSYFEEGNYAAWPDIRMYAIRICVSACNDTEIDDRIVTPSFDTNINFEIDTEDTSITVDISGYETKEILNAFCIPNPDIAKEAVSAVLDADYEQFTDQLGKVTDELSLGIADAQICWRLFVICGFTAFFISMFWGWLIRRIGAIIIWVSIALTLAGMFLLAYFLVIYSEYAYLFGYTRLGDVMYYGGYVVGAADCAFALAVCFMWNRIRLAIELAKETTRALNTMWTLFFYPAVPFICFGAYLIYWLIASAYIGSVVVKTYQDFPPGYNTPYYTGGPTLQTKLGLPVSGAQYVELVVEDTWQYLFLFHFFVLLWMMNFISYHTYMVIAGVYAEWYFADWKDKKETVKWRGSDEEVLVVDDHAIRNEKDLAKVKQRAEQKHNNGLDQNDEENRADEEIKLITKLSRFPLFNSFKRVTWYHLGTIAFGSLLIAIIEFMEYTLDYFEKKFRTGEPSPLQKMVICLIKCTLKCIKCILNRINRNGLIITSIYGWPFCASSMKGISIILRNIVRASALEMVSGYLGKIGKLCIISANVGLCVMIAKYQYAGQISSILFPAVVCFFITYIVCKQYMHLYEVGLSTIFICFLIDEERNKNLGEMKAAKRLRKIIGATKPPKKYLYEKVKSIQNLRPGMLDPQQAELYGKTENFGNSPLPDDNDYSHDESFSVDDGKAKEIKQHLEMQVTQPKYSDAKRISTAL